ncbi:hypothetical protein BDQ17DRAFT_1432102 [Cyathus striatus]|nr:hypothetical protein BDQ17DRAFT_1432102 [Cyathus striatus]
MSSIILRIDDRNSAITYSNLNTWILGGRTGIEYKDTTTCPIAKGATAAFNFSGTKIVPTITSVYLAYSMIFIGTSVEVYGTLDVSVNNTVVQYTIDDKVISGNTTYPSPKTILFRQLLFHTANLTASNHTLSIAFVNETPSGFCLDYFEYTPSTSIYTHSCSLPFVGVFWTLVAVDIIIVIIVLYWKLPILGTKLHERGWFFNR